MLACVGSVADSLLELTEEEATEGKSKSFNFDPIFNNVVPHLLTVSGQ